MCCEDTMLRNEKMENQPLEPQVQGPTAKDKLGALKLQGEEIAKKLTVYTAQLQELKRKRGLPSLEPLDEMSFGCSSPKVPKMSSEEVTPRSETRPMSALATPKNVHAHVRPPTSPGASDTAPSPSVSSTPRYDRLRRGSYATGLPSCVAKAKRQSPYVPTRERDIYVAGLPPRSPQTPKHRSTSRRRSATPVMGKQVTQSHRQRRSSLQYMAGESTASTFQDPTTRTNVDSCRRSLLEPCGRPSRVPPRMGYGAWVPPPQPALPTWEPHCDTTLRQNKSHDVEPSKGIVSSIAKRLTPRPSATNKKRRRSDQLKMKDRPAILSDIKLRNKDGDVLNSDGRSEVSFESVIQLGDRTCGDGQEAEDVDPNPTISVTNTNCGSSNTQYPVSYGIPDDVDSVTPDMTVDVSKISFSVEASMREQPSVVFTDHEQPNPDVLHSTLRYPLHSTLLVENLPVDVSSISEVISGNETANDSSVLSFDVDHTLQERNQTLGNCSVCNVIKLKRQTGQGKLQSPRAAVGLSESDFWFDHTCADSSLNATRGTVANMRDITETTLVGGVSDDSACLMDQTTIRRRSSSYNQSASKSRRRSRCSKPRKSYTGPTASPLYEVDVEKENRLPMSSQNSSVPDSSMSFSSTFTSQEKKSIKKKMKKFNNSLQDSTLKNITTLGYI